MINDTGALRAFCEDFRAAYRVAGSPSSLADFSDTAPSWPLESPEWAQDTRYDLAGYPQLYVEHERLICGEHVTATITQGTFVDVELVAIGEWAAPAVYLDDVDSYSIPAAIELAGVLAQARPHLESAQP